MSSNTASPCPASTTAVIRYVLGTNLPTELSPAYTGPIQIANTTVVRARAFESGLLPGEVRSQAYLRLDSSVAYFKSDLPIMVLHNMGKGQVPASQDQYVAVQIFEPLTGPSALTNAADLAAQGIFHKRGSSTLGMAKASFFLEIRDEYDNDRDVSLAGLPEESDWVLYAPNWFEPVLMHNPMAFALSRAMGRYATRTRFVEVYLKDDSGSPSPLTIADYNGVYVLCEKIKVGDNRVDIDKLRPENTTPPSVTGGYLLSIDRSDPGTSPFYAGNASINYLDPNYEEITTPQRSAQRQYIHDYFNRFYQALSGPNADDPVSGYAAYIDVDSWIDHHIHNVVTFNVDALRLSGYFYKPRNGRIEMGPVWDFDRTQGSQDGRDFNPRLWRSEVPDYGTDMFNPDPIFSNPWYSLLFNRIDFWQRWIDRYQEFRTGALAETNVNALIDGFANEVRQAQPREAQRWSETRPRSGSRGSGGFSYNFPGTYQGEVDFMKYWYANRLNFIDTNFLARPFFSRNGGSVNPGYDLSLSGPAGATIYYTLDGSDPRQSGGAIAPGARIYAGPLRIDANTRVTARARNLNHANLTGDNKPPLSSPWSGLSAATFVVQIPSLVLTEFMYHPAAPPLGNTNDPGSFEYLELKNTGTTSLNLLGFRFTRGIDFAFSNLVLASGEHVVVAKDPIVYSTRYGNTPHLTGPYLGQLDNAGEQITLEGPAGEIIFDVIYNNAWYRITDGHGFSLVSADSPAAPGALDDPKRWRPSSALGGSPGLDDPPPPVFPIVLVNEALTHTDPPLVDTIELYNAGSTPADIGGWLLTDEFDTPLKYRIPPDTLIPPGGYFTVDEAELTSGHDSFLLSDLGEDVYLFSADAQTNLTGYVHGFSFGPALNGISFGRQVTSAGREQFVAQTVNTLGSVNGGPRIGPVVLNEIMFHPAPVYQNNNNTRDEFIELRNVASTQVLLADPEHATNTWRLRGGVDFDFPPSLTLPPDGYLLVVGFDPAARPDDLAAFRSRFAVASSVLILGPYSGQLENNGESVGLLRPNPPEPPGSSNPGYVPYVLVDEVEYQNTAPWPTNANATGHSLQRIGRNRFGNDPQSWQTATPTAGAPNPDPGNGDADSDGLPDDWELAHGLNPDDPAGTEGASGDPDADSLNNLQEYLCGTHPRDAGSYLRIDFISVGTGGSATLKFQAIAGKTYTLLYRNTVAGGPWIKLTDIQAQPATVEFSVLDPEAGAAGSRYYRLITPAVP
ncbi:MAG TPA: CotH kinase family protein [Candidatus Paceibacterota bacterium]|nr:CotH kinase family protein [Candidatus Paceibacterota bacterium]